MILIPYPADFRIGNDHVKAVYAGETKIWFLHCVPDFVSAGVLSTTVLQRAMVSGASLLGFQGDGALTAIASFVYPAVLSGDGTLSTTTMAKSATPAVLSGDGALSATMSPARNIALAGNGTLTATVAQKYSVPAALSGNGTVSATMMPLAFPAPALAGAGVMSGDATYRDNIAATATGAYSATRMVTVTIPGYVPQTNDIIVVWPTALVTSTPCTTPAGWTNPRGGSIVNGTTNLSMACVWRPVTPAEVSAGTNVFTLTNFWNTNQTGEYVAFVARYVSVQVPIDGFALSSSTSVTHGIAAIGAPNVRWPAELQVCTTAGNVPGSYTGPSGGFSMLAQSGVNMMRSLWRRSALVPVATATGGGNVTSSVSCAWVSYTILLVQDFPGIWSQPAFAGGGTLTATAVRSVASSAALSGGGALSATAAIKPAAILLGEWGFLDNLNDTSGNGHAATYTPGSASNFSYVTGPHLNSRAAQFAHANDVISYGRTGLEPTLDGITIMAWTRLSPTPSSGFVDFLGVLNKARAAGSSRSRMGYGFSQPVIPQMKAVARWKDDLQVRDAGATWNDANWHHLAVVDGNTRWATYLDGVQIDGGTRALGAAPNTAWENFPWLSGRNGDIGDNYAHPSLSVTAVRIFQGELTTTDINTWMNTPIVPVVPSPYAYYDFHEGSGSTAADIMGNMPVLTTNNPAGAWSGPNAIYDFHNSALNLVPPWTICVNAYTPDLSSTYLYFLVANNAVYFYSANAGSNASIRLYTGSVDIISPTNVLVAGQEQKIVWTCDGTTTKIYLNGTQAVSSPNIVGNLANALLQVAGQNGGSWPSSDLLRDLRIWQVALTATQVAAL